MVQRLLITGDNEQTVATVRRIAEERGLTVTILDGAPGGGADAGEWTWRDDHEAYERRRQQLGEEFAGRYIAMHLGEVIGVGDSAREAAREGLSHLRRPEALFVVMAGEPLPEPEPVGMQMDAPRSIVCEQ